MTISHGKTVYIFKVFQKSVLFLPMYHEKFYRLLISK